jgi:hypothetical protein
MLKSLTSTSLATVCGLVAAVSFDVLPSFSLANSLGVPSVLRAGAGAGFGLQIGNDAPTFPISGTPAADNFNTNEFYSVSTIGGTNYSNSNYVSVAAANIVTSNTQNITAFGPSLVTVEFDYRLGGIQSAFSVFDVDTNTFNNALAIALTGSPSITQNFTYTFNTTGLGPNQRFAFGTQAPDSGVNFSNFNFTATPVPFEFNPAMGIILTGALFGGNQLLKKAKKARQVG